MKQLFRSLRKHPVTIVFYLLFVAMWGVALSFSLSAPPPDRFNPLSRELAFIPIIYALLLSSLFLAVIILKALISPENKFYLLLIGWIVIPVLGVLLWLFY